MIVVFLCLTLLRFFSYRLCVIFLLNYIDDVYSYCKTPNTGPLGGKQNGTILGDTVLGGPVLFFKSIRIKTGERMVARYSGGRYWRILQ